MAENKSEKSSSMGLNLSKVGSWKDIVITSEEIKSLLRSVNSEEVGGDISNDEIDHLFEEWKEWRPRTQDDFSEEMREKTAKQSSVSESKLEEEEKDAMEGVEEVNESIEDATEKVENGDMGSAAKDLADAVKNTGQAIDCKVRQGVRKVEEGIYEKVILKANSLYFDNSVLNVVLSKNIGADSSERYQLTLHSNVSRLRELFAERIDWDEC